MSEHDHKVKNSLGEGLNFCITMAKVCVQAKGHVILAVAGGSCSGKSLFARKLEKMTKELGMGTSVLGWDDYYRNVDDPKFPFDSANRAIYDLPESYLIEEFRSDVESLLAGFDTMSPIYDKKTSCRLPGPGRLVKAEKVIITEGLFVISALRNFNGVVIRVFIDADRNVRVVRRLTRDVIINKLHDTPEEALEFINQRAEPYYKEWVEPQRDLSDLIIVNNS